MVIGYLDIETAFSGDVTVFGLLRADRGVLQLVGDAITAEAIRDALDGLGALCTYHGEGFDLPVLSRRYGLDLFADYRSLDLGLECRSRRLRGGLKAVEERLGIPRRLRGVNGYDAMLLWNDWVDGDREALEKLLAYNREDVVNLAALERRLSGDLETPPAVRTTVLGV